MQAINLRPGYIAIQNCLRFCPNDEFVAYHLQVGGLDAFEFKVETGSERGEREV
jgi:hypothetical protein